MIRQRHDAQFEPTQRSEMSAHAGLTAQGLNEPPGPLWRLWTALVPGVLLWFQVLLIRFDALVVPSSRETLGVIVPLAALFGTVGLFFHLPVLARRNVFPVLAGILGAMFLIRLVLFSPPSPSSGFVVVPRTVTDTAAELFLCWQALILWKWRSEEPLPATFPCLALVTLIFALNRTLPRNDLTIYVLLVSISLLLPTLLAASHLARSGPARTRRPTRAKLAILLACVCVLLGTWTTSRAWSRWLPDAQTWFATRVGGVANESLHLMRYATSGSLSAIRRENSHDPNRTALRVYCNERPGYLAGRVFDQYSQGSWRCDSDQLRTGSELTGLKILRPLSNVPDGVIPIPENYSVFELDKLADANAALSIKVENDPRRGRVYFTPLGCDYLIGSGDGLALDEYTMPRLGVSVHSAYITLVDEANNSQPISRREQRELLNPPQGLDTAVVDLAEEVCRRSSTPQDKIRLVRGFFRDNFDYSLDPVTIPQNVDPLNHFLKSRHPAHCEFFASGAVALLRLQGVPARYVTGYRVMQLEEENQDYWIARNRDAHAWAEAYDSGQQKWVIVEATPGFEDPTLDEQLAEDDMIGLQGPGLAFAAENANALAQWWQGLPAFLQILISALTALAFGLIMFVVARRARLGQVIKTQRTVDPRVIKCQRMLKRMDRRLVRTGFSRPPAETLHQFADRLRSDANGNDPWLLNCADWYIDYAQARFTPARLEPPALPDRKRKLRTT